MSLFGEGLYPPFVDRLARLEAEARAMGVRLRWTSGLRTWEEQAELWAHGRDASGHVVDPKHVVTLASPGCSWHNYGLAQDFALLTPEGAVEWSETADLNADGLVDWYQVGLFAEDEGLEWGGRWPRFRDLPHLQWPVVLAFQEAQRLYASGGVEAVWATLGP